MSGKKQLLDPLGTMCKMVALNFSEISTKISIQHHILTLQQPSGLQCVIRSYNRDSKENIFDLYFAIIRVIQWYMCPDADTDGDENWMEIARNNELKKMVKYMYTGLTKLQETYSTGNVVLALQLYKNLLNDALEKNFDEKNLPGCIKTGDNLLDYDKIKNFWTQERLKSVCDLYDKIFENNEISKEKKEYLAESYLRSIFAILDIADKDFQELITNSNQG